MLLVTGCAGFIGSNLVRRLLDDGKEVVGIDNFSDYYPRPAKEKNMEGFIEDDNFRFIEGDLADIGLGDIIGKAEIVFHQAAQAGVRASWGDRFGIYIRNNILATQRLLEACKGAKVRKFIYASSSSIYGDLGSRPTGENAIPRPVSPYGVSKLSGEHLCYLYWKSFGIPVISLRYFSVYGPHQRPDMAFHRFIDSILRDESIVVYGSGDQTRDFTYISDIVDANLLAAASKTSWEVFNISGGSSVSVNECIRLIEKITGRKARISHQDAQKGDPMHTAADITKARKVLGYRPRVSFEDGLRAEVAWLISVRKGT